MKTTILMVLAGTLVARVQAQSILFDFDNAPVYAPLPIYVTAGGVTAHLSGSYSIQSVSTATVVPVGFTGNFIFPSGIYASDLVISFSTSLTDFSIQYAPQELACDSSATMRVTAYRGTTVAGTATTNAVPGTWPVETLALSVAGGFDNVVVHYDKPPVTGGDYGVIFIADNMMITPAPPPIVLRQGTILADGAFQFGFSNEPARSFTVLASTDPNAPLASWTALGTAAEIASGEYQFTDNQAGRSSARFYCVRRQ